MEAEFEQDESLCLESCCRLELINEASKCSQMKINFQFSKCRLRKMQQVRNKFFT